MSTREEWRVTGDPGSGYPEYLYTFDNEEAARNFVASVGGWNDGPHLDVRTITETPWRRVTDGRRPVTERPWPENVEPTPEQLADWLATADRDERIELAEKALRNSRVAFVCSLRDHGGYIAHLERELARARERETETETEEQE